MLPQDVESEIATLAARYGPPRRVVAALDDWRFSPLTLTDRYGEVCMVIRRPNGRLITAIKSFYPAGAFRLLTGGVGHGERIAEALRREVAEETGLDVAVRRFLAVIEYRTRQDEPAFATFAFLLDELGGELAVSDPDERIGAFREVAVAELPGMAAALEAVADDVSDEIGGSWREWGRFRAVAHRAIFEALNDDGAKRPTG